jgi:hypothetical protein
MSLGRRQQSELRAISTRALITPTSFVNTYEWGDLKADRRRLVERYFDAFLYLSNWGTRRLMLRLPAAALGAHSVGRYCIGDSATAWTSGEHLIIDLVTEDEDGAFEEDWSYGVARGGCRPSSPLGPISLQETGDCYTWPGCCASRPVRCLAERRSHRSQPRWAESKVRCRAWPSSCVSTRTCSPARAGRHGP